MTSELYAVIFFHVLRMVIDLISRPEMSFLQLKTKRRDIHISKFGGVQERNVQSENGAKILTRITNIDITKIMVKEKNPLDCA